MKHLPWIALLLATPAAADTKTKSIGFYRLATVTVGGKKIDLSDELKKGIKNDNAKYEADLVRMTIDLEPTKLTIGIEQVMGERGTGTATYCRVSASVDMTIANGKFTIPSIAAVAHGGVVRVKTAAVTDTSSNRNTTKCNVRLEGGTYTIKGSGKAIELAYTGADGVPVTAQLVADTEIDLPARATAFAGRK